MRGERLPDNEAEIIEAMAIALAFTQNEQSWGDLTAEEVWSQTREKNRDIQRERAQAAYEASPLERYRELERAADELMDQFDAFQTRPDRNSAFGISFERWAALRTALQALADVAHA